MLKYKYIQSYMFIYLLKMDISDILVQIFNKISLKKRAGILRVCKQWKYIICTHLNKNDLIKIINKNYNSLFDIKLIINKDNKHITDNIMLLLDISFNKNIDIFEAIGNIYVNINYKFYNILCNSLNIKCGTF